VIEKLLEDAVIGRLENVRLRSVFLKLSASSQAAKETKVHIKRKSNLWLYRFYQYISVRGMPLMNKTSVETRAAVKAESERIVFETCWRGLKMLTNKTLEKMKQVRGFIRGNNFKQFRQIRAQLKHVRKAKKEFVQGFKNRLLGSILQQIKNSSE
jgi:hypothetical protein